MNKKGGVFRFRNFPVYRKAIQFMDDVQREISVTLPKEEMYKLKVQLDRALYSIILNIAEGSDRSTDKDFAKFLNNSQTSLNEVVSCFDIAKKRQYIPQHLQDAYIVRAEELLDEITAFRKYLLNSSELQKIKQF